MRRRLLGGFFAIFFLVMSISVDAYADSPSTANPYCASVFTSQNDYLVYPVSNRFDATLVLLGMWHTKIQITQDMFVKLSNEDSGGHFYELASHFSDGYDPPSWADDATNPLGALTWLNAWTYIAWNIGEPWEDFLWSVHAEDYEISQAKADLQTILDGGSLGTSGSTGFSGFNGELPYVLGYQFTNKRFNMVIAGNVATSVNNYIESGYTYLSYGIMVGGYSTSPNYDPFIWLADKPFTVTLDGSSLRLNCDGSLHLVTFTNFNSSFSNEVVDGSNWQVWTFTNSNNGNFGSPSLRNDGSLLKASTLSLYGFINSSSGGGSGGDNHWPEPIPPNPPDPPDPNPEPDPDPPDPGPGIDLPDVDFPDITIEGSSSSVSFPTINIESPSITVTPPTNTSSADYTPWLSAILSALNSIIADLDSHCQHLRQAIRDYSQSLANSINASMDSHCQHLRQAIKDYSEALASSVHDDLEYFYNDLTAYLAELAQWLVEHLNWSVDVQSPDVNMPSFDDSGIVAWLKRIYLKLGGTKYPKPDPISDTGDALDWWSALLQWIANALSGFITAFVGDVGAVVEGVLTRFPFSIPWDILAYLALLDAERVTPVIVVTVPAVTGWWSQFSVTIDLSAYNLAMATVRSMMLVWWGFVLVMRTDWILLVMGRTGAELATGFVSRLVGNGGD